MQMSVDSRPVRTTSLSLRSEEKEEETPGKQEEKSNRTKINLF